MVPRPCLTSRSADVGQKAAHPCVVASCSFLPVASSNTKHPAISLFPKASFCCLRAGRSLCAELRLFLWFRLNFPRDCSHSAPEKSSFISPAKWEKIGSSLGYIAALMPRISMVRSAEVRPGGNLVAFHILLMISTWR